MKFYEIIYETGANSVACYEDDEEAMSAVKAHHDRAKQGLPAQMSNPDMGSAERVVKVLKYDEHPANFMESQVVESKDVKEAVDKAISKHAVGNLVSVPEIAASVREITTPVVESPAHESNYKMEEVDELTGWDN